MIYLVFKQGHQVYVLLPFQALVDDTENGIIWK
jgi:hypothetical protein